MEIGITSYAYRWACGTENFNTDNPMTPKQLIHKAIELNINVVQLCENIKLHKYFINRNSLNEARLLAEENGISIEVGARDTDIDVINFYLETAKYFRSKIFRLALDSPGKFLDVKESISIIRKLLSSIENCNIKIALENHFHLDSNELVEIVSTINHPHVGVCLDTANSIGLLERPSETVKKLASYAISVHIKDFVIVPREVGFRILGTPIGEGSLDIEIFLNLLRYSKYAGNCLIELWMEKGRSKNKTLANEDDWVKRSINRIRQIITVD